MPKGNSIYFLQTGRQDRQKRNMLLLNKTAYHERLNFPFLSRHGHAVPAGSIESLPPARDEIPWRFAPVPGKAEHCRANFSRLQMCQEFGILERRKEGYAVGSALFLRPGIISPEGEGGATDMKKNRDDCCGRDESGFGAVRHPRRKRISRLSGSGL